MKRSTIVIVRRVGRNPGRQGSHGLESQAIVSNPPEEEEGPSAGGRWTELRPSTRYPITVSFAPVLSHFSAFKRGAPLSLKLDPLCQYHTSNIVDSTLIYYGGHCVIRHENMILSR